MTQRWRIDWKGRQVSDAMERATMQGIDETMANAVTLAKTMTPVRTGVLQGSERFEPSKRVGGVIRGFWGSFDVRYAIWVEIGTFRMRGRYMFRRAADAEYPHLAERIRKRFLAGSIL